MRAPTSLQHHALRRLSLLPGRTNHAVSACVARRTLLTGAAATGSAAATRLTTRMGLGGGGAPPPPSAGGGATTKFSAASSHFSPSSSSPLSSSQSPLQRTAQIANHLQSPAQRRSSSSTHRALSTMASSSAYSVRKIAAANTLEHRVYIEKDGVPVSPFHDIPLYANQEQTILNMIVEIPRWTNGKLEVRL